MSLRAKFAGLARLLDQRGPRKLICIVGEGVSQNDETRFVSALQALEFEVALKRDTCRIVCPGQVVVVREPDGFVPSMGSCVD